jgi:hypothetical protein
LSVLPSVSLFSLSNSGGTWDIRHLKFRVFLLFNNHFSQV